VLNLKAFTCQFFCFCFGEFSRPQVFGPPGSGSVIICTNPDPSIKFNKQKVKKPWKILNKVKR
jgi:hypothetical protein